jgi:hypothetical protein
MLNRIIPRTFKRAFPAWDAMGAGAADDDEDDYHVRVRKKVYRCICTYEDEGLCELIVIVAFTSGPLDHLWREMQKSDETEFTLWECIDSRTCGMFEYAILEYKSMLDDEDEGRLRPLLHHFQHKLGTIVAKVRVHVVTLAVLIWWRFRLPFLDWPFRLGELGREGISDDEKVRICLALFEAFECCIDDAFGLKAKRLFIGARAMALDSEFSRLMKTWIRVGRISNMHVERLLAEIGRSVVGNVSAERILSAGTLTQYLKKHMDAGGYDPRMAYRANAIAEGVPLRSAVKKEKPSKNR